MNFALAVIGALGFAACGDSASPLLLDYPLEGDQLHPEGIAFDGANRRFLFGSLTEGTLFTVDAAGAQRVFAEASEGAASSLGLAVDEGRRWLSVCTEPAADGADTIRRYDLDTQELLLVIELSAAAEGAQCNDLIADSAGVLYVTDPAAPRLYRVGTDGTVSIFVEDEQLTPTIAGLGTNGIVLSEDEGTLFVAYFSPAQIFAVPVNAPSELAPLELSGDNFAGISVLSGPDGLAMQDGVLVAVFDDAVHRITLGDDRATGTVQNVPLDGLSGLSTAAIAEGELYVSKSEVVAQVLGQTPELPFRILRLPN